MVRALIVGPNACGCTDLHGQRVRQRGQRDGQQRDEREADQDARDRCAQAHHHGGQDQQDRLEDEDRRVAQHPAEQQREPADRGDAHPLHDPVALLDDDHESGERGPEQAELEQQSGDQDLPGTPAAAQRQIGEQRAEEEQVQQRHQYAEEHRELGAQGLAEVAPEDQRGVLEKHVGHFLEGQTATGVASAGAGARPVMARNVSWSVASIDPPYWSLSALGVPSADHDALVDDHEPVGERVRLVEVVRGEEDGRAVVVAQSSYEVPEVRPARRGRGRWSARRGTAPSGGG